MDLSFFNLSTQLPAVARDRATDRAANHPATAIARHWPPPTVARPSPRLPDSDRLTDEVMHEASGSSSKEEAGDEGGPVEQPPITYRLILFFSWLLFSLR
jgi:hypothetical protein